MLDTENQYRSPTDPTQPTLIEDLVAFGKRRGMLVGSLTAFITMLVIPVVRDASVKILSELGLAAIRAIANNSSAEAGEAASNESEPKVGGGEGKSPQNNSVASSDQSHTAAAAAPQHSVPTPPKALGWVAVVTSARAQDKILQMQDVVESIASTCSSKLGHNIEIRIAQAPNFWWAALAVDPDGATQDDAKEIAECFDGYAYIQGPCFAKTADFYGLP
jgi:hypothetical protein